jgi:hypothetical protein
MSIESINETVKNLIQIEVVKGLNSAPEALEKLVKAALSSPVDPHNGSTTGYGNRVPYLDYLVGSEIRDAARRALQQVMKERAEEVEAIVRSALTGEDIVRSFAKAVTGAVEQEWRIEVKFAADKDR